MTTTKHLYLFDEVVSSLQKSIRRGLLDQSLFWAGELYNSNNEFFLFKKLFTIATEDIGLAEPNLILYAWNIYKKWTDSADRLEADILCIKLIKILVGSKKNRMIGNLLIYLTKFKYPPDPDSIENLDFNAFRAKFPNTADYIIETVKKEKKGDTNQVDIFSALVQFVEALSTENYNNTYFFAHLLNLVNIEEKYHNQIIGRLGSFGKLSDINITKASMIIWGIITNKYMLHEIGFTPNKLLTKIIKRLYLVNAYGLGNSNYNLLFAITILFQTPSNVLHIPDDITITSPENLSLFLNNKTKETIFQRRKYSIPDYALDLSTKRGRGMNPKKGRSTNYYLFNFKINVPTDCIVPDINSWPSEEIMKSYGSYKNYAFGSKETHVQFNQREGNYLVNMSDDIDTYFEEAFEYLLDIEKTKNYTFTKYSKMIKFLIDDIIKDQIYWIVTPNYYLQSNPLSFNNTEIIETHLYEHELLFDTVKINSEIQLYSAKICYPEGYCPVSVIVYGPILNSSKKFIEQIEYINNLKNELTELVPIKYHILKMYPTLKHNVNANIDNEYPFIIMQNEADLVPLENIIYHLGEYYITKSYILLLLFHYILPDTLSYNSVLFYSKKNKCIVSFEIPEDTAVTSSKSFELDSFPLQVIIFIKTYIYEILFTIKEWYKKIKNETLLKNIVKMYHQLHIDAAC